VAGINNCPRATLFYLKHFEPELVRVDKGGAVTTARPALPFYRAPL
jgi:hypothetical protein